MKITKLDLALLSVNLFVLGGLVVLMTIRGASAPLLLLMVGTAGMTIGKLGRAFASIQNFPDN